MFKKEEKKGLMERLLNKEKVALTEYSINEIEEVIRELVEYRINNVRNEEALKLLDAVGVAVGKVRAILAGEEKK